MNKIVFNTEKHYRIKGNINNGTNADGTPRFDKENVVRKLKYATDTELVAECGRRFIIDKDLTIGELNY